MNNFKAENNNIQEKSNEVLVIPIIRGTISFSLGKKADETATHKWCVFVRGNNNEDLSCYIKEVVFTLHNTFPDYIRTVNKAPFELYELGWGEFDIKITIVLHDPSLKTIEFNHPLKLYQNTNHQISSSKKPVISESYDEIIVVNPRKEFFKEQQAYLRNYQNLNKNNMETDDNFINKELESNQFANSEIGLDIDQFESNNEFKRNNSAFNQSFNYQKNNQFKEANSISSYTHNNTNTNKDTTLNLNNKNLHNDNKEKDKLNYIPNIEQNFFPISDEAHYRQMQDAHNFILKEIQKTKLALEENEKSVINIKKKFKEIRAKNSQPAYNN